MIDPLGDDPLEPLVPPGAILRNILDEHDLTMTELAARMGTSLSTVSYIIAGKTALTPATAIRLERVLGIPATVWVGLEGRYRLGLERRRQAGEG